MITKEKALNLINHVKDYHRLMAEADKDISICGYGNPYTPELHIFYPEQFMELATVLGIVPTVKYRNDEAYPYSLNITVEGVHIFCLTKEVNQ